MRYVVDGNSTLHLFINQRVARGTHRLGEPFHSCTWANIKLTFLAIQPVAAPYRSWLQLLIQTAMRGAEALERTLPVEHLASLVTAVATDAAGALLGREIQCADNVGLGGD